MTINIEQSLEFMNDHCLDFLDSDLAIKYDHVLLGPHLNLADSPEDIYESKVREYFNFNGNFKFIWIDKYGRKIVDNFSSKSFAEFYTYYDENFVTFSYLIGDNFLIYNNNRDNISIIFHSNTISKSEISLLDKYLIEWHYTTGIGFGKEGDIYLKTLIDKLKKVGLVDKDRFVNLLLKT